MRSSGETQRRPYGLVDTNIVIHWDQLDPSELPRTVAVSAVTIAELASGVHAAADERERARRLDVLQRTESAFDPLAFDGPAARAYGRVNAAIRAAGRSPRSRIADQMIAAIAAAHDLPLYTTNIDDFAHLDGVVDVVEVTRPEA